MNHIDNNSFAEEYINDGYCIGPAIFNENQVIYLRKSLEDAFSKDAFPRTICLLDIDDQETVKIVLDAINSDWIQSIIQEIGNCFNTTISVLPEFTVQRNYHVDRFNDVGIGWHRDCWGETKYDYCKKKLFDTSYVFGKIAIYLQENSEYGGSIDLIPSSPKDIEDIVIRNKKLVTIPLRLIQELQSKLPKVYKILPENVYMHLIKAKKLLPEKGAPVLFSSKMLHRGSPITDSVRNEVSFVGGSKAETPAAQIKYSIYCQFGSTLGLDSFMYDNLKREGNSLVLQRCVNQTKQLEYFCPKLALLVRNIMNPLLISYLDMDSNSLT